MGPPANPPPKDPPPLTRAQLRDIQGDIWSKGFPKYNETYYFFSIEKAVEFTHCLKELLKGERPLISNLERVKKDHEDIAADKKKAEDKAIAEGKTAKDAVIILRDLANALIAFSSGGLQIIQGALPDKVSLKLSVIQSTDPGFFKGMDSTDVKDAINDPDKGTWDDLFRSDKIHGLLKIGGSSATEVDKLLDKIKTALKHDTVIKDVVGKSPPTDKNSRVDGATRREELRGKEHFGFEDGISQPLFGAWGKIGFSSAKGSSQPWDSASHMGKYTSKASYKLGQILKVWTISGRSTSGDAPGDWPLAKTLQCAARCSAKPRDCLWSR